MSWSKRLVVFLVLVAMGGGLLILILYRLGGETGATLSIEQIQSMEGIPVEVVRPVRRDFTDYLLCDGNVVADVQAMLRAKMGEVVEAVNARIGEPIKKGQLLVEFRKTDLEAETKAAEAAYQGAANNYKRYRNLFEQGLMPEDRLEQARTAVENAEAALRQAKSRLAFADLRSPIDGFVEQRWVEPGEFKGEGKELLSIVNLSTVEVRALVPEQDVGHLSVGGEGEFQLESGPEWLTGAVSRISPSTQDPNRFFNVYLKAENPRTDGRWLMRPGMYAEVRFVRQVVRDALAVPASCVVYEGNVQAAYLVKEGVARVPVMAVADPDAEKQVSFVGRLGRGWARLKGVIRREKSGEDEVQYEEVEALLAERARVEVLGRSEGYVRVKGNPIAEDRLVIVNPRDVIRDGVRVKIGGGEED